jgi:hypothetical protein
MTLKAYQTLPQIALMKTIEGKKDQYDAWAEFKAVLK